MAQYLTTRSEIKKIQPEKRHGMVIWAEGRAWMIGLNVFDKLAQARAAQKRMQARPAAAAVAQRKLITIYSRKSDTAQ